METDNQNSLQAALVRLLEKQRADNLKVTKLKRKMAAMDRNKRFQYLITLGAAWEALGEQSSEGTRGTMQRFLDSWISRPTDIEILKGTKWAVNVPTAQISPAYAPEAAYDSDYREQE